MCVDISSNVKGSLEKQPRAINHVIGKQQVNQLASLGLIIQLWEWTVPGVYNKVFL